MSRAAKGSAFEREICKQLSKWWTDDARDDIFWRAAGSGGRATIRSKKGIKTSNSDGDIMALDPIGEPFLKCFCLELKRGYSRHTPFDVLDKPPKAKKQVFEEWIEQAEASAKSRGSLCWMIIHRRDKRMAMVYFPQAFAKALPAGIPTGQRIVFSVNGEKILGMTFAHFLAWFTPDDVRQVCDEG